MTEEAVKNAIIQSRNTPTLALTRTLNTRELDYYYNKFQSKCEGFYTIIGRFPESTLYYSCFSRNRHYIVPLGANGELAGMAVCVQDVMPCRQIEAKIDF